MLTSYAYMLYLCQHPCTSISHSLRPHYHAAACATPRGLHQARGPPLAPVIRMPPPPCLHLRRAGFNLRASMPNTHSQCHKQCALLVSMTVSARWPSWASADHPHAKDCQLSNPPQKGSHYRASRLSCNQSTCASTPPAIRRLPSLPPQSGSARAPATWQRPTRPRAPPRTARTGRICYPASRE